jgi:hypothetical protein
VINEENGKKIKEIITLKPFKFDFDELLHRSVHDNRLYPIRADFNRVIVESSDRYGLHSFLIANNYFKNVRCYSYGEYGIVWSTVTIQEPLTPDKYPYLIPSTLAIIETVATLRTVNNRFFGSLPNELLFEIFSHLGIITDHGPYKEK